MMTTHGKRTLVQLFRQTTTATMTGASAFRRGFASNSPGAGKSALITGASAGLGEAISRRLASDGYNVFMTDVDDINGQKVADEIGAKYLHVDISKPEQVEASIAEVVSDHGSLDALVNNAGVISHEQVTTGNVSLDEWKRVTDVNLNGTFYGLRYGLAQMEKQEEKGGSIVNMCSTAGFRGIANISPYIASKFAVRGLTQAAAVEYGFKNIRVNAIAPAACETPLIKSFMDMMPSTEVAMAFFTAPNAMPGLIQPEDIAAVASFLLSDEARFITGHTLAVDAGSLSRIANAPELIHGQK